MAQAGWYQDPGSAAHQRYWDGAQWTMHTAPLPSPPGYAQAMPAPTVPGYPLAMPSPTAPVHQQKSPAAPPQTPTTPMPAPPAVATPPADGADIWAPATAATEQRAARRPGRTAIIVTASTALALAAAAVAVPFASTALEDVLRENFADTSAPAGTGSGSDPLTDVMDTAASTPLTYMGEDLESNPVWRLYRDRGQVAIPEEWQDVTADYLSDTDWYEDTLAGAWEMGGDIWHGDYATAELNIYDATESAAMTVDELVQAYYYYVDEENDTMPVDVQVSQHHLGYEMIFMDFSETEFDSWVVLVRGDDLEAEFTFFGPTHSLTVNHEQLEAVVESYRFPD